MAARVWMGDRKQIAVTVADDVFATVRRTAGVQLVPEFQLNPVLTAPLSKGEVVGVARWRNGDTVVREVPLIAAQSVAEGSLVDRLLDKVMMLVDGLVKQFMQAVFG